MADCGGPVNESSGPEAASDDRQLCGEPDVAYPQLHEIARTELAIDSQIEEMP